ncbi:hypothetical protein JNUCC83_03575 [Vagococcus sp. JNUCC 83]
MPVEDFVNELSHLKTILVLKRGIDMERFNQLYNEAIQCMIEGKQIDKQMMEEFIYFSNQIK